MPRRRDPSSQPDTRRLLDRLRALSLEPERQRELAREIILSEPDVFVLQAALQAVGDNLGPSERSALLDRYLLLEADGPRHDPGGHTRAAIIGALRKVAIPEDAPLFERAALTEEFSFQGGAPALQAAGLLALADQDAVRASIIAIPLLAKRKPMSPEPALTAARLLSASDEALPLLMFVSLDSDGKAAQPEVTGEVLRGLRTLPGDLLAPVFERYVEHQDDIVLLGLCDLVIEHAPDPVCAGFLARFLASTERYDVYHYAVTAVAASHRADLLGILLEAGPLETDRLKLKSLVEALDLITREPGVADALGRLRGKLAAMPAEYRSSAERPSRGRYDRRIEIVEEDDEFDDEDG